MPAMIDRAVDGGDVAGKILGLVAVATNPVADPQMQQFVKLPPRPWPWDANA
jgi:hypothetical protein